MKIFVLLGVVFLCLQSEGSEPDLLFSMAAAHDLLNSGKHPSSIKTSVRSMCAATCDNNGKLNTACMHFRLAFQLSLTGGDRDDADLLAGKELLDSVDYTQKEIMDFIENPDTHDTLTSDDFPVHLSMAILYENMGIQSQNLVYLETAKDFLSDLEPRTQNQFNNFIEMRKTAVDAQIFKILNPYQIISPTKSRFSRVLICLGIL